MKTTDAKNFSELLNIAVAEHADKICYSDIMPEGFKDVTYREFKARVEAYEEEMKGADWSCTGIILDNSVECLAALFASVITGRQTVLLNPMASVEELKIAVAYADVDHIIFDPECYNAKNVEALQPYVHPASLSHMAEEGKEGNLLFFTSGTTELAKAVVLTPRALCNAGGESARHFEFVADGNQRNLMVLPLSHIFGFTTTFMACFMLGIRSYLCKSPKYAIRDLAIVRPTILISVPTIVTYLTAAKRFNPELKLVVVGGSQCRKDVAAYMRSIGITVFCGYGLTETSAVITCNKANGECDVMEPWNSKIKIAEDGEILVLNDRLMTCYYKAEEATRAIFDEEGYLRTGDTGYLDEDGMLHLTGKKKDMLVLESGVKVFCPEWEMQLNELLGADDLALALKDGRLVLVVATEQGDKREEYKQKVTEFNKTKSYDCKISDVIISPTPLPRTATGKIKRYAIKFE